MQTISLCLNENFILHYAGSSDSASHLRTCAISQYKDLNRLKGLPVAIHGQTEHITKWLLALDGVAAEIVLVPFGACDLYKKRILQALPDLVVIKDATVHADSWPREKLWPVDAFNMVNSVHEDLNTRWLLATSGTTSTPKLVTHSLESLSRSVVKKPFQEQKVWGLLYDPARFAGLQVLLQAMIGGDQLVASDPRLSLSEQIAFFLQHGVNAISATPTLWRKILMTPGGNDLLLKQVTLGGEIADARTLKSLSSIFPDAHITHIYASTEAGVGFAVHDGCPGFPYGWLRSGVKGAELSISSMSTLMIRPNVLAQGYFDNSASFYDEDGWIDTGDLVEVKSDRVLFNGRANGSVNIGGNKVMPEEVEMNILELDFVIGALVRSKSSSVAGSLLEAFVVLKGAVDRKTANFKIKSHCREHLAAYKVPAFIRIVDDLPTTAAGKLAREGIAND